MPQRVGHVSLGNLEVLHQKANGSTIELTHCEQEIEKNMTNFSTDDCRNPQKMPNYSFGIFQFLATVVLPFRG